MEGKQSKINKCRICEDQQLHKVIELKSMPFTDEFVNADSMGKEFLGDIEIAVCKNCGCVQNLNNTDMDEYYNDYTYSVQSSAFAVSFMRRLAEEAKLNFFADIPNPKVIEIGSGSGEQLLEFKKLGFEVLGVEPSQKLVDYARSIGVPTIHAFYDKNILSQIPEDFKKVNLVISSYTFDHIPEPVEVLNTIHENLVDGGIMIHEVHDLELIKQRNEYCLFEHEHYTYLNEKTMSSVLCKNKFKPVTFDLLSQQEKRANSLLSVSQKVELELPYDLDVKVEISELENLAENINESISRINEWLKQHNGKKVVAYGAGGRGVMTIAAIDMYNKFAYMVDKNPKATGIFAPKTHLPVYPISQLDSDRADVVLIFSFGYFKEIVEECCSKFGYSSNQFVSLLDVIELSNA